MMARIKAILLWVWTILTTPAATLSLAFLTLGGFVGGVMFWGAFNTALELTNTEKFCTSCHEMRDNVYQELTNTVHFTNRSGVRASCPDCHVPHQWTDKIARKCELDNFARPVRVRHVNAKSARLDLVKVSFQVPDLEQHLVALKCANGCARRQILAGRNGSKHRGADIFND